jgi:hypothetical protein
MALLFKTCLEGVFHVSGPLFARANLLPSVKGVDRLGMTGKDEK